MSGGVRACVGSCRSRDRNSVGNAEATRTRSPSMARDKSTRRHADRCAKSRRELGAATRMKEGIANERVPIQLAQCRSAGLAISSPKMQKYIFQIKRKEATLSNGTRKLLWSEINKKKQNSDCNFEK